MSHDDAMQHLEDVAAAHPAGTSELTRAILVALRTWHEGGPPGVEPAPVPALGHPGSNPGPRTKTRSDWLDWRFLLVALLCAYVFASAFLYHWAHPEMTEMQVLQAIGEWLP